MADTNAVGGLRWVKDEILTSLNGVRSQLEKLVERDAIEDSSALNGAVSALSEVRGVLAALELIGPARLAEEMQTLCEDFAAQSVSDARAASEALMFALIQLPDYLEKVAAGYADVPRVLLPTINDLRASRGSAPLSEAQLLVPTSVLSDAEVPPPDVQSSWRQIAGEVRPQFHIHLLQWFRGVTPQQGLADLGGLFHRLQRHSEEGIFHELFLVAEAVVEGLREGSIAEAPKTKALVGHLDRIIKPLAMEAQAWPEMEAQALLLDLLSLIARCESSSHKINELRTFYGLDQEIVVEGEEATTLAAGAGPEAFAMLIAEARRELAPIKDTLDLFARGDRMDREQLVLLEPQLRNLANTLAFAGADDLGERLRRCGDDLAAIGQGGTPAEDLHLITIAEELLSVEVALGDLGSGGRRETRSEAANALVASTLREARVDIAKAEHIIGNLVTNPSDHRALSDVPGLFRGVAGALRILGENEIAEVLDLNIEQIERRILEPARAPLQSELDLLAQSISGIELHIAGLSEGEPYRANLTAESRRAIDVLKDMPIAPLTAAVEETYPEGATREKTLQGQVSTTPSSRIDPEFLDVFLEEAQEEEQTIRAQFERWQQDESNETALAILRRSFHTLKGSGRLVGALSVGEFARAVEMLLNRVIGHTLPASPELIAFMAEVVDVLPDLISAEAQQHPRDVGALIARAESFALSAIPTTETPAETDQELELTEGLPESGSTPTSVSKEVLEEEIASAPLLEEETSAQAPDEFAFEAPTAEAAAEIADLATTDEELLDIFRTEAQEHLSTLHTFLEARRSEGASAIPSEAVVRALHTLTGGARMTGVQSTAAVTAPLERLFLAHREHRSELDTSLLNLLDRAINALEKRLASLPGYGDELSELHALAEDLRTRPGSPEEHAPHAEQITTAEDLGALVLDVEDEVAEPVAADAAQMPALEDEHLVAEHVQDAIPEEEIPATEMAEPEAQEDARTLEVTDETRLPHEEIQVPEEAIVGEEVAEPEPPKEAAAEETAATAEVPAESIPLEAHVGIPLQEPAIPRHAAAVPKITDQEIAADTDGELLPLPEDPELIALFLEDARGLVDRLDKSLQDLQLAPTESKPLQAMQRSLHTLKGNARLSGLTPIGDLSHAFESLLTAVTHGKAQVDDDTLELSQRTLDALSEQIDAVEQNSGLQRADHLVQAIALAIETGRTQSPEETSQVAAMAPSPETPAEPRAKIVPSLHAEPTLTTASTSREPPAPQIRVRSDLINRLINGAGEISIYRARVSQQGGRMTFRLGELDRTVNRLRAQLRNLEIETEAQILYRYERDTEVLAPEKEEQGFDPLELDRFSTLQQLSRSLAETVNDLVSLRTLLNDLQSETDTLLQQQARISDELQDGLLRTRMVPFAQAVPRLHRLVRQTAQQTGKQARLDVFGPEVEVDRSIQERILAPLEHLLRNAVAHGIELPEQRLREGKAAAGVVSLILNREGNDVVITVADDGAGLNLEAIRRRALDKGLLTKASEVGEEELTGLILESGFSTADQVSQIAGRGVGLDVVNAEVKQLSGTFDLETQPGRGTQFVIRLPLTLAIVDALLVQLGDQMFAIPHATVEAVSRIPRADLEACYRGEDKRFTYAGREFRVMYLGSMLQPAGVPDMGEHRWLPVVLTRSGEQRIAFHVDQFLGNQRVVVKPLGPELSNIRWLSGGTILPDGRVAMILDLLALIRSKAVQDYQPPAHIQVPEHRERPFVMVVDDSLTVRRVTSRMLQRQNMDVVTAQDGVDALTRLEERVPDVILLDIEMPRMDGYELTRHIRRSERLKDIPLIMITSRTGEKHRRHALSLGVNRYLGKPYQEADLLDEISSVLVESYL